ncbi:MAG: T9SS C-terminal target domain-containing protein [Calditrichaeota bacterium]|nr:MAG: T9SS C-terminal target domain-containing protein [Calditrichota bacterium]
MTGKFNEPLLVEHGGGISLFKGDGEMSCFFTPFFQTPGIFPTFAAGGDTLVIAFDSDSNFDSDTLVVSTNYVSDPFVFKSFPSGIRDSLLVSTLEAPLALAQRQGILYSVLFGEDSTFNGIGYLIQATTQDLGDHWNLEVVYREGDPVDGVIYFPENFAQAATVATADGVQHIAFNAYGGHLDSTGAVDYTVYPVGYWNSRDRQIIEVTNPEVGRNPALSGRLDPHFFGGLMARNAIGNSFPSIAAVDSVILVTWTQCEFNGPPDSTTIVFARDDSMGGQPNPDWAATDIWGALSWDGGRTWSRAFYLAGAPEWVDAYGTLDARLEVDAAGEVWAHLLYFYDPIPGMSLFEYLPGPGAWIYKRVNLSQITGLRVSSSVPQTPVLYPNYPNPFNPVTNVEFGMGNAEWVSLRIYDLLGREVKTLVNERLTPGNYTVQWDGTDNLGKPVASGVYFYRLTSGNHRLTRKMLLIR